MSTAEAAPAFSLELDDEHRTLRDWLAGFAADVLRPNGAEWDRRAETPWHIIAEAARLGVYGTEMLNVFLSDQTGLALPIYAEELFFGDAGLAMSFAGTLLPVLAIHAMGTSEQIAEWVPQCFGDAERPHVAAFCSSEPDAGSDVAGIRASARYEEARDEWVLNGQKA